MLDRVRIRTLRDAGHTLEEIAATVGVGKRSVQRILKEPPITSPESAPTPVSRGVGRPREVDAFRGQVERILKEEPSLPTVEILSRVRGFGYTGGKSAVYELVKAIRPPKAESPEVRFEGVPGEFSQHDFGSVKVIYADGSSERIHFFASRLKYSRWTHVVPVPNEKVEPLIRALVQAFESFGGVPLRAVFDNPKTIVINRTKGAIEWNPTFAHVPVDYGFGVELCWPRRANQKGSVENLVGWVKGSFFKVRRFHDREDLEQQLTAWLEEANTQRPSRATNQIPAERMKAERERLTPLAIPAAEYPLRITTMVRTTGFVEYERVRYSMPPKTIGIPGTLFLYPDRVRIVTRAGTEVEHPRHPAVGNTSYRNEDRVAELAAVHGQRARLYQKRQEILDLGPPAEALMTEWVHQPHVLVIDEVGYLTYSADAANVLFQVVDHRYLHKKPMLFTTNKPLTQWGRVLHDPDLAEAITDRVLERGRFIQLRGPSYRTRHLKNTERGTDVLKGDEEEGDQPCS